MPDLVFFECAGCAERQSPEELACPHCGETLVARYDRDDRAQCDGPQAPSGGPRNRAELPKRRVLGGIIQPY
jgi:hypothetical protein